MGIMATAALTRAELELAHTCDRIWSGTQVELDVPDTSAVLERIADSLLEHVRNDGVYYDGIPDLRYSRRKRHQIDFVGGMWVGDARTQWIESFLLRVTDKRTTKQGINVRLQIGSYRVEAGLNAPIE